MFHACSFCLICLLCVFCFVFPTLNKSAVIERCSWSFFTVLVKDLILRSLKVVHGGNCGIELFATVLKKPSRRHLPLVAFVLSPWFRHLAFHFVVFSF